MNAALGGVSAGGFGIPLFDVTQNGGIPKALVANQSGGNAGGVTLSKFSSNTTGRRQGPHEGDGSGVAPTAAEISTPPQPFSSGEADPAWLMAREEPISPNAVMPAAINKVTQSTLRNRLTVNVRFRFSIIAGGYVFTKSCRALSSFFRVLPVRVCAGKCEIVQSLPINDFSRAKIDASVAELKEERSLVSDLI